MEHGDGSTTVNSNCALPGTKIHIVYTLDGCAFLHYN